MEQALLTAAADSMNVDSLIQSALAAGIPPLQVVQFVQQRQALQQQQNAIATQAVLHQQQLSVSQTPTGSTSSSTPVAVQSHPATLSGFSLANVAATLAQQQQVVAQTQQQQSITAAHQQAQQMVAILHQAQQQVAQQAHQQAVQQAQQQAQAVEQNSLPWPIFQPTVNVPYFDMNTYHKVNLDVQASALSSGMDLPLHDMNTLRFFFNFGVHHARAILLREHFQMATPGGQQANAVPTQTQQQAQVSNALLGLQQHQDASSLYQQTLLKSTPESANNAKQMGGSLPGQTNISTADQNTMFQLQRDLSTSISINQLQNTLAQINNKMAGQAALGQQSIVGGNFKASNDQIEALLLQNSMLGQPSQAMQFRIASSTAGAVPSTQQVQQQNQPEGLHRPTAVQMATMVPLGLTAGGKTPQTSQAAQAVQQAQQQLLGGLGISSVIQQQVPVDPAPRMAAASGGKNPEQSSSGNKTATGSNPAPLTSGVLASFLQEQQAHDRMKSTSLVRGAISDIVRPPATTVSISSTSPAIAQTNSLITPSAIPSTMANGGMSLATQLSLAMMNGVFFQDQKNQQKTGTGAQTLTVTPKPITGDGKPPAGLNVLTDDPNAHLLAGTSPFVKLMGTTPAANTRSLTAGTSAQSASEMTQIATTSSTTTTVSSSTTATVSSPSAANIVHPYLLGPFGGADFDPTTFLATTELNYTEAFRRSHERETTPDGQRRKSGIYMLPSEDTADSKEDSSGNKKKTSADKPVGPTMINYVNSCLNHLKSKVQSHGVSLTADSQFRPIDFSSRPIDPIFRKAREQLDKEKDYTLRASMSPALLQRIQTGNQRAPDHVNEENKGDTNTDDGSLSAPASATSPQQTTSNKNRSKSEQPPETSREKTDEELASNKDMDGDEEPESKRPRVEDKEAKVEYMDDQKTSFVNC